MNNLVLILSIVGAVVLLGAIGGLLFVRGRRPSSGVETKDFAQDGLNTVAQPATTYSYEPQQAAQQTYTFPVRPSNLHRSNLSKSSRFNLYKRLHNRLPRYKQRNLLRL